VANPAQGDPQRREAAHEIRGRRVARNLNKAGPVRATVSLLTLAFFSPVAAGCISNEYVIPHDELRRLVATPPAVRGQQVHVVQELGSRRTDAVDTDDARWQQQAQAWPPDDAWDQPPPEETRDTDVELEVDGDINWSGDGRVARHGPHRWRGAAQATDHTSSPGGWQGRPTGGGATGWQGHPPSGGSVTSWRGTPPSGGGSGWKGVPSSSGSGSGGGGSSVGNLGGGSGGGGGNGGDAMVVLAVVMAAVAVVMAIGLVSSEGVRFDGLAQMSPWQPVHLKQRDGNELVIALGDLSPVALEGVVEAKVMDDEGYGIRKLDHLRLDRRMAPTFKLDGGSMTFGRNGDFRSGVVSNMQFGLFVRPWLGLLLTAAVGGAGDEYGATITRHTFGFETQSLPVALGPLQLGGYFDVGAAAIASTATGSGPVEWGTAIGGGVLTELQVTSRMALTLRAGANEAFFADTGTSSPAATVTAGIALY